MMVSALTAIMSFVLGVMVAALCFDLLVKAIRSKRGAGQFVGGLVRGMAGRGIRCLAVPTIEGTIAHLDLLDLAVALESAVDNMGPPPPPRDGAGDTAEEGV